MDMNTAYRIAKSKCGVPDGNAPAYCKFHFFDITPPPAQYGWDRISVVQKPFSTSFNLRITIRKTMPYDLEPMYIKGAVARPRGYSGAKGNAYLSYKFMCQANADNSIADAAQICNAEFGKPTMDGVNHPIFNIIRNGNAEKYDFKKAMAAYRRIAKKAGIADIYAKYRAMYAGAQDLANQTGGEAVPLGLEAATPGQMLTPPDTPVSVQPRAGMPGLAQRLFS
jgi:hypothetical protein